MNSIEQSNYKNFRESSDKPFFAAYLNTAKTNLFIILRDISERIGLGFDLNDDDNMLDAGLWKILKSEQEPEIKQKILDKLNKQFPFAEFMVKNYIYIKDNINVEQGYYDVFQMLIKQLMNYRNYYSHAEHDDVEMNPEIIDSELLQKQYDAAWREVKKRFTLKDEEVKHLLRLGKDGENTENDGFFYSFLDDENNLSEKGFAYFLCLWLQRKDAKKFLKKLSGFKRSAYKSEKATLELFTLYNAKVPQPRLTSDNSQQGLLLDMINELSRCPQHLYPLLNDENRMKFEKERSDAEEPDDGGEYEAKPILKRYDNRFFYFALRYLDSKFNKMKFHVDLGNYCFHVYEQEIDGEIKKRRWNKRITSFGNLLDFVEGKPPTNWAQKVVKLADRKLDDNIIYMTETTPHYHVNGNNIGFKIDDKFSQSNDNKDIWPELKDFDPNNQSRPNPTKHSNEEPDCYLSLYELPAILFYQVLHQNNPKILSPELIIEIHQGRIQKFFEDIEEQKLQPGFTDASLKEELYRRKLDKQHIPKAIIKYLLSKPVTSFNVKAKVKLDELLSENTKMLSSVERQRKHYNKKPGSKDYIGVNYGRIGDFLARDMMRFQKPSSKDKGKANNTEFQLLQSKLAMFQSNKSTIYNTFRLCNLIGSDNSHPFMIDVNLMQCEDVVDYYIGYLEQRRKYLQKCIDEKNYKDYHFLRLGKRRKSSGSEYIKKLAGKLRGETIMNLPRGLFLKPILKALDSNPDTKELANELKNMERVNVSYIISRYFDSIKNDKPQGFYDFKKSYEFLNELFDDRTKNEMRGAKIQKYYRTEDLAELTAVNKENDEKTILPFKLQNALYGLIDKKIERFENENKKKKNKRDYLTPDQLDRELDNIEEKQLNLYPKKYKEFTNSEKQIRLAKTCDMVLFLMIEQMFKEEIIIDKKNNTEIKSRSPFDFKDEFKLSEIMPNSKKGILNKQVKIELPLAYTYETNMDKIRFEKKQKTKPSEKQESIIVREEIKIKDAGNFRGFLKDRRISSLLPYLPKEPIHFEALQKELEEYETARMEVLDKIYNFEKEVINKKGLKKSEKGFIDHLHILESVIDPGSDIFLKIRLLRNAFSHSEYPAFLMFKDEIKGDGFNELKYYTVQNRDEVLKNSVAIQFKNMAMDYYDSII